MSIEHKHNLIEGFTPLEAECPAVYRRDECLYFLANTGFNAPCELLTGFTKKYSCHKLVYYEHFTNVYEAINREKQIKRWRREKKQNLIRTINRSWRDLSREWG